MTTARTTRRLAAPDRDEPDGTPIGNHCGTPNAALTVHNQAVTSQPARQRC